MIENTLMGKWLGLNTIGMGVTQKVREEKLVQQEELLPKKQPVNKTN
jgi:hypothetical protein